ncbi:hypothetical protein [Marinicella meishanensis]|uniref:hypothetical protein n=1 Tax=Marinicella meishanensis TaxID=2873263 RepID=UPI001CC18B03|nr:hypothetical protein [Marinicella sp. NBU2979]
MSKENLLNTQQLTQWQTYVAAEESGIRSVYLTELNQFIELILNSDLSTYQSWVYELSEDVIDRESGFLIRMPLFEQIIFPVLHGGFKSKHPGCARWLAGFCQHIYRSTLARNELGEDFTDWFFLYAAIEHNPTDQLAKQRLFHRIADYLEYTIHELPSGVLWGNNGASIEQCSELMELLDEFKELANEVNVMKGHEHLMKECEFHFQAYADYLSNKSDHQSYVQYLELNGTYQNEYHRLGQPGGPGCQISSLDIEFKDADGNIQQGHLMSAEKQATEIELLRTIAHHLGVQWGHDDLGWWAAVIKADK